MKLVKFNVAQDIIDYLNVFDYAYIFFEDIVKYNHAKLYIEKEYKDDPNVESNPSYKEELIMDYYNRIDYKDTNGKDDVPFETGVDFLGAKAILQTSIRNHINEVNELLNEDELEKLLQVLNLENSDDYVYLSMIVSHLDEIRDYN